MSLNELKEFSTRVYSRGRRLSHDLTTGIYNHQTCGWASLIVVFSNASLIVCVCVCVFVCAHAYRVILCCILGM